MDTPSNAFIVSCAVNALHGGAITTSDFEAIEARPSSAFEMTEFVEWATTGFPLGTCARTMLRMDEASAKCAQRLAELNE